MPGDKEPAECPNCGIILAKFKSRMAEDLDSPARRGRACAGKIFCPRSSQLAAAIGKPYEVAVKLSRTPGMSLKTLLSLNPVVWMGQDLLIVAAGAALSLLCLLIPFASHILSVFVILVHEMGHCIFWLVVRVILLLRPLT